MGTLQTWRRAYGALKDTTKVGLAHVNSDYADLDVAIVKATNHVEVPPKERHLRKILFATSAARPRADVAYCIHALSRRLHKTRNWTVALKTLIVIHRLLREGDPTFREELLNFSLKGRILQLSNFKDDSSPIAWDCSAWVRTYALFLEERLECFRALRYDVEAERLPRNSEEAAKGYSRTRDLDGEDLLDQLPALQQLLYRLVGCRPEGAAVGNYVIQYALALVLKESFKIYCAINDGIINLVDKFFEMPRHEAIKALDIYKRAGQQAGSLSDFYEVCRGLELARNFQFPALREPPQSFLATMEEYIKEAPRIVTAPTEPLLLTYKPDDALALEEERPSHEETAQAPSENAAVSAEETADAAAPPPPTTEPQKSVDTGDLLDLSFGAPDASAIEGQNALALAIVPTESGPTTSNSGQAKDFDATGWELALVSTSSADLSATNDWQLAGGLDSLTLNSLYDEGAYRAAQRPVYGAPAPNPFEVQDPFAASSYGTTAPSHPPQMATMDNNPFGPFPQPPYHPLPPQLLPPQPLPPQPLPPQPLPPQPLPPQAHPSPGGAPNPFGDTGFEAFPVNSHGPYNQTTNNPFGGTSLV